MFDRQLRALHLYVSWTVIIKTVKNHRLGLKWRPQLGWQQNFKIFLGDIRRAYQLSTIQSYGPAVVLSTADTDYDFQWMSRYGQGINFVAISNAPHTESTITRELPHRNPHPAGCVFFQYYCVHGTSEVDLFRKHGHKVKNFVVAGSMRASHYRHAYAKARCRILYDICLVSQYVESRFVKRRDPIFVNALLLMYQFVGMYVKQNALSLCIALRSNKPEEVAHFITHFGEGVCMQAYSLDGMSTYFTADYSDVVIAHDSSAAREAFCWGKKTLFVNTSGDELRNCVPKGPWLAEGSTYAGFANTLDNLRKIEIGDFISISDSVRQKLIHFDPNRPAGVVIRDLVANLLSESNQRPVLG